MKPFSKSEWITPGGRGRLVAAVDGPGPDLLLAGGEVALEAEQVVGGVGQAVEARFGEPERVEELRPVLRRQLGQLGLDLGGEGDDLRGLAVAARARPRSASTCALPLAISSSATLAA